MILKSTISAIYATMQTAITIIILVASAIYASRRIYTLFNHNDKTKCHGCKGCEKDISVKLR